MQFIIPFLIGTCLQQGMYELSHKGFHFDKSDALVFTTVIVGVGTGLYQAMDIPNSRQFSSIVIQRASPVWLGQANSVLITVAVPGL